MGARTKRGRAAEKEKEKARLGEAGKESAAFGWIMGQKCVVILELMTAYPDREKVAESSGMCRLWWRSGGGDAGGRAGWPHISPLCGGYGGGQRPDERGTPIQWAPLSPHRGSKNHQQHCRTQSAVCSGYLGFSWFPGRSPSYLNDAHMFLLRSSSETEHHS